MTFIENYEAIQVKLSEEQRRASDAERKHLEAVSALRVAADRAAQAEARTEMAEEDAKRSNVKMQEALEQAQHATVLGLRAVAAEEDAKKLTAMATELTRKNGELSTDLKEVRSELRDLKEVHAKDLERFERAEKLLAAFAQRAAADSVINSSRM